MNVQLKEDGFILASSLCRPPLSYRFGQQTRDPGPNRGRAGRVGWITIRYLSSLPEHALAMETYR